MSKKYASCPYWAEQNQTSITCESPLSGGTYVKLTFAGQKDKTYHKQNFCCCSFYKGCPIYQLIKDKYSNG